MKFLDKVRVKSGFFGGHEGTLIDYHYFAESPNFMYPTKLKLKYQVSFPSMGVTRWFLPEEIELVEGVASDEV